MHTAFCCLKIMTQQKIWDKILSQGETIQFQFSISKRYRYFGLLVGSILSLFLFLAGPVGLLVLFFVIFYFAYYLKLSYNYALTNQRIIVRRGWFSINTISIDYDKITDVLVKENFWERILTGSGDVIINTAGINQPEIVLEHIASPNEIKKKIDEIKRNMLK